MFGFFPDKVVEENMIIGLTNELVWLEHREVFDACKKKAEEISAKLAPKERRFMVEMKAKSIILPFSKAASNHPHLAKGDMVTFVDLNQVVDLVRKRGLTHCLDCSTLNVEISRAEDGSLIVEANTYDPVECMHCDYQNSSAGFPACDCRAPPTHPKIEAELKLLE